MPNVEAPAPTVSGARPVVPGPSHARDAPHCICSMECIPHGRPPVQRTLKFVSGQVDAIRVDLRQWEGGGGQKTGGGVSC